MAPLQAGLLLALIRAAVGRRAAIRDHGEDDLALSTGPLLTFNVYRAGQSKWEAENSDWQRSMNFASAAGVMWYLQNEVVGVDVVGSAKPPLCERKYEIDRIYRYKVTMRSTPEALKDYPMGFLGFVAMDKGECTVPQCNEKWWKPYGYVPGCQVQDVKTNHYEDAVWYSFPGRCPNISRATPCMGDLETENPGGACRPLRGKDGRLKVPDGSWNCTYIYEPDGFISLDDLTGISESHGDFSTFCQNGGIEFKGPKSNDTGVTIDFWKGYTDVEKNKQRVRAMLELFQKHYPKSALLDDPGCTKPWVRPAYWPAPRPRGGDPVKTTTTSDKAGSPSPPARAWSTKHKTMTSVWITRFSDPEQVENLAMVLKDTGHTVTLFGTSMHQHRFVEQDFCNYLTVDALPMMLHPANLEAKTALEAQALAAGFHENRAVERYLFHILMDLMDCADWSAFGPTGKHWDCSWYAFFHAFLKGEALETFPGEHKQLQSFHAQRLGMSLEDYKVRARKLHSAYWELFERVEERMSPLDAAQLWRSSLVGAWNSYFDGDIWTALIQKSDTQQSKEDLVFAFHSWEEIRRSSGAVHTDREAMPHAASCTA